MTLKARRTIPTSGPAIFFASLPATSKLAAGAGGQNHHLLVTIITMELLIGAVVSLLVQALKQKSEWHALAIVALLSFVAAGLYNALVAAGYWETVLQVLLTAGAFYAFVIQRFEGKNLLEVEEPDR